jgi:hypothetical protein
MIYEFRSDDGEVIEVDRPMSKAPDIGTPVKRGGKVYRRVMSRNIADGSAYDLSSYPKISSTLPQFGGHDPNKPQNNNVEWVKEEGRDYGKVIIHSQHEERDLCRRYGFTRDYNANDL